MELLAANVVYTRSRFSHEQYAGGTWTNPSMSRVATRRSVRGAHKTRTRNVVLTETPRFDVKQTRVRFPVVATNSVRPSGDVFFCPSFARGRGADTFHVTLHTETTTCTTFREVCDRIRARLALT